MESREFQKSCICEIKILVKCHKERQFRKLENLVVTYSTTDLATIKKRHSNVVVMGINLQSFLYLM